MPEWHHFFVVAVNAFLYVFARLCHSAEGVHENLLKNLKNFVILIELSNQES